MRLHKCGWVSIQSGERLNGIQEVSGSIPLISTNTNPWKPSVSKDFFILVETRGWHRGNFYDTIAAVRNRILQLCGEHEISINKLATISALPPSSIKNILYGKSQNPKRITIKMICDGLGITLGEFFSTKEFDVLEQEIK